MLLDKYIFNSASLSEGFTQSEISTLSNCGMLWNLKYNIGLKLKNTFSWALAVGSAVHDCIEQLLATRGESFTVNDFQYPPGTLLTPAQIEKEKYWKAIVQSMVSAFALYFKEDFEREYSVEDIEMELDTMYKGFRLRGKLDWKLVKGDGTSYIVDWKTCSRLDKSMVEEWDFRFQFMFYPWAAKQMGMDIHGFMPTAIKKPELRMKVAESLEAFAERVRVDMIVDPEKYFYREMLPLTKDAMEHFENKILAPKIARLQLLTNSDPSPIIQQAQLAIAHDMNTDYCQRYGAPCEMIRICRHGWEEAGWEYEAREQKHSELVGEAE